MKTTTLAPIYQKLRTRLDLDSLIEDITILQNSTFRTDGNSLENSLRTLISSANAKLISDALREEGVSLLDKAAVQQMLTELKVEIQQVSDITIFLSFEPTIGIIELITKWIKENVSEKTIIHYKQDPEILGGIVIMYRGIYKDYSLNTQVQQVMQKNQETIKGYLNQGKSVKGEE